MAEICVYCFLKDFPEDKDRLVVDNECLDLCEMCGEYKHCVICVKPTFRQRISNFFYDLFTEHPILSFPLLLLLLPIFAPIRFIQSLIRKYKKHKKTALNERFLLFDLFCLCFLP